LENYIEILKKKLEKFYDLEENVLFDKTNFDLVAIFNQKNARYFLLKELEYYSFDTNEYILYKKIDNTINFTEFTNLLKNNLKDIVVVDKNHMSSIITILIEKSFPIDEETIKKIKKFKFHKSFRFGLEGWVNVRFMVIDTNLNKGYSNKFGKKELARFLNN
jgi:exopolysaccharide biosynthesis protein